MTDNGKLRTNSSVAYEASLHSFHTLKIKNDQLHSKKIFPAIIKEKIPCQKVPLYPEIFSLSVAGNFPYTRKEFIPMSG
jgi:hypothetical protein